jgi:hypothetical protein
MMKFERSPVDLAHHAPVIFVRDLRWDLSNLCQSPEPRKRKLVRRRSLPVQQQVEVPLYPDRNEIRSSTNDVDIDEVFARAKSRIPTPSPRCGPERRKSVPRSSCSPSQMMRKGWQSEHQDLSSLSGIQKEKAEHWTTPVPTNKAISCSSAPYDRKEPPPSAFAFKDELSSPYQEPDRFARRENARDFLSPGPRRPERLQVEVSPGEFMSLRGAAETAEAIESGLSKTVFSWCCGVALRCVPDCQFVICPDCRIMSPVPQKPATLMEDDEWGGNPKAAPRGIPSCPSIWQEDEPENMSPSSSRKPAPSAGGVGLGLKV